MSNFSNKSKIFALIDMKSGDSSQCWPWKQAPNSEGRPYWQHGGKRRLAYHVTYELVIGDIPKGKLLRHKCDNPICCNPYHLELGDHQQNMDDMKQRERHGLPHHAVKAIKKLLAVKGSTHKAIAELYGVSRETITAIANSRTYKHVDGDSDGNTRERIPPTAED